MFRLLIRAIVVLVVLVGVGAFLLGWWGSGRMRPSEPAASGVEDPAGNRERAREIGAEVGERTAAVADRAQQAVSDASITSRIKAKMALDESVKALDISVDTDGSTVTLNGVVTSAAQRERALQLARETEGVTRVVDRLRMASTR